VAGSSENGNETWDSIKREEFLDHMRTNIF